MKRSFDVFLSHNSRDKPAVRQLAQALKARGFKVWLDEEQLVPGRPWQQALEEIIRTTSTAAVLIGKDGLGPWQDPEMRACLSGFVKRRLPVIPVLLPKAPAEPELPLFLQEFTWVDLRSGLTDEGLRRLEWGIRGPKLEPPSLPTKPPPILNLIKNTIKFINNHKLLALPIIIMVFLLPVLIILPKKEVYVVIDSEPKMNIYDESSRYRKSTPCYIKTIRSGKNLHFSLGTGDALTLERELPIPTYDVKCIFEPDQKSPTKCHPLSKDESLPADKCW